MHGMDAEEIKSLLSEENDKALFADGFDNALIGIARRCGQPSLAVYDSEECIRILSEDMTREEAEDYFSFNVSGAWLGDHTPIFLDIHRTVTPS